MNDGGYVSLSQLIMRALSPLMSINLFKGRLRLTQIFKETKEVLEYLNTNLTDIYSCGNGCFHNLTDQQVNVSYSKINLSQIFFINNVSTHYEIESIRLNLTNNRKPTDILVLTDGYSFSAAGLYIKYLQKNGRRHSLRIFWKSKDCICI